MSSEKTTNRLIGLSRLGSEKAKRPPSLSFGAKAARALGSFRWWRTETPTMTSNAPSGMLSGFSRSATKNRTFSAGQSRFASLRRSSEISTAVTSAPVMASCRVKIPVPQPHSKTFASGPRPQTRRNHTEREATRTFPAGVSHPHIASAPLAASSRPCRISSSGFPPLPIISTNTSGWIVLLSLLREADARGSLFPGHPLPPPLLRRRTIRANMAIFGQ